jgi:hypothetical protein
MKNMMFHAMQNNLHATHLATNNKCDDGSLTDLTMTQQQKTQNEAFKEINL